MEKKSAIAKVNERIGYRLLNGRNTSFANVNVSKAVWWLNINPIKFESELHLLLADDSSNELTWLRIEANAISFPDQVFRIRQDTGAVDLEISSHSSTRMLDVKSGGIGYDFSKHIELECQQYAITSHPPAMRASDGMPLFENTGVPVQELHAYLREDWNVYGFLHKFPSVSMEQALAELERDAREKARRIIDCNEEVAGSALVFERTDVPVKYMFDYLADLKSLKDFHWDFPDALLEHTSDTVLIAGRILELDAYRGKENGVAHSDIGRVSGSPVFVGTRLPLIFLFQRLAEGETLKDFRFSYSSADPAQLVNTVGVAGEALTREFHAAVSG